MILGEELQIEQHPEATPNEYYERADDQHAKHAVQYVEAGIFGALLGYR